MPSAWNVSEILIHIQTSSLKKMLRNMSSEISNFLNHIKDRHAEHFLWNCHQVNATRSHWGLSNIGSDNGLGPSGNKPLPELMLTQIYVPYGIIKPQWVNFTVFRHQYVSLQPNMVVMIHVIWTLDDRDNTLHLGVPVIMSGINCMCPEWSTSWTHWAQTDKAVISNV